MPVLKTALFVLFALTATTLLGQNQGSNFQSIKPTEKNAAAWRSHILPEQDDLVWRNVAWKTSFGEGVAAANESDKPLLLWVMNGHPFGCT